MSYRITTENDNVIITMTKYNYARPSITVGHTLTIKEAEAFKLLLEQEIVKAKSNQNQSIPVYGIFIPKIDGVD